jgi:hypothetical protein
MLKFTDVVHALATLLGVGTVLFFLQMNSLMSRFHGSRIIKRSAAVCSISWYHDIIGENKCSNFMPENVMVSWHLPGDILHFQTRTPWERKSKYNRFDTILNIPAIYTGPFVVPAEISMEQIPNTTHF